MCSMRKVRHRRKVAETAMLVAVYAAIPSLTVYAGWEQDGAGYWLHRAADGSMDVGWLQDEDGGWYYLAADGRMLSRQWLQDSGNAWYYLNVDGRMLAGQWFLDENGVWYYFGSDGKMLANCVTPDGYRVQADGAWDGNAAKAAGTKVTAGSSGGGRGSAGAGGSSGNASSGGSSGNARAGDGSGNISTENSSGNSSGISTVTDGSGKNESFEESESNLPEQWLAMAKAAEAAITGESQEYIPDERFLVSDKSGQDVRLVTIAGRMVGMTGGGDDSEPTEWEVYLIGRNMIPDGVALSITYPDEISYSHQNLGSISIGAEVYTLSKFILVRKSDRISVEHNKEEKDHYGYWNEGDVLERELGGESYPFRCIDQNYSDGFQEEGLALFLCDGVIPADFGSGYKLEADESGMYEYQFYPGPIVQFGDTGDYKYSDIRRWLKQEESGFDDAYPVQTGVSHACSGSTQEDLYGKFKEEDLKIQYLGSQRMTDRLFIFSVEEALRYKEWLWRFEGSQDDNPESQTDLFCKGYWLRTPADNREDENQDMVYIVDLVAGNLHPELVSAQGAPEEGRDEECFVSGTTGVRPAFAMEQKLFSE